MAGKGQSRQGPQGMCRGSNKSLIQGQGTTTQGKEPPPCCSAGGEMGAFHLLSIVEMSV